MIRNSIFALRDSLAQANFKTGGERGRDEEPGTQKDGAPSACRVALIGFGTVGRAVAKILWENGDSSLRLTHICNRNIEKKKQAWAQNIPTDVIWTDDVESVLNSDVDIVIELIGGLEPAGKIVRGALEAGKSVVTANKQLIARHGPELLATGQP